jgi:ribosomal protein S18 acetylase RimI-like enzyme
VTAASYRVVRYDPSIDVSGFSCGSLAYDDWLTQHAAQSVNAGVCAVYLLVEESTQATRVVGYYAINPTQIARVEVPNRLGRGWPTRVPAWRIGKLAIHVDLQSDSDAQWGRQLLRDALETIVRVSEAGGGKVIVVDADNHSLIPFYERNGFQPTGIDGSLTLYLKVSTARAALGEKPHLL